MLVDVYDAYVHLLPLMTSLLHLRSFSKQSHALHWHPSMDPRDLLQRQQPLFPALNPWRVSRPGVQLQQLNVSWYVSCANDADDLVLCSSTCTPLCSDWLGFGWTRRSCCLKMQSSCSWDGYGENSWPWATSWTLCEPILNWSQVSKPHVTSASQPFLHCLHHSLRLHHMLNLPWRGPFMGNAKKLMLLPYYYF